MAGSNSQGVRRFCMTFAERKKVLEEFDRPRKEGKDTSQKSIAEWAFNTLKFAIMPSQSTISRHCKKITYLHTNEPSFNPEIKRKIGGTHPEVDIALLVWINEMHARGVFVSSDIIREIGIKLLDCVNAKVPPEKIISLTDDLRSFRSGFVFGVGSRKGKVVRLIMERLHGN